MAIEGVGSLKTNLAGVMDNLIARDDKLDEMMSKTDEMSDLTYSITTKVASTYLEQKSI